MTLEHQAARRKAPVAGVTTQGMVTASRGEALSKESVEVGHPQPSPTALFFVGKSSRQRMLFTDYMAVGFSLQPGKSLRYSRALPATGLGNNSQLQCFHRSVGEPAEGSLNLSTTTQRTHRTRPQARPPPGTACALENTRSAHGSAGGGPAGRRAVSNGAVGRPPPVQLTQPKHNNKLKPKRNPLGRAPHQNKRQLSTTDILAPASMKNAAKCDT